MNYFKTIFFSLLFFTCCFTDATFAQTVDFTYSPSSSIETGDTIYFTNTSTGFSGSQVYKWNFGHACGITGGGTLLTGDTCNFSDSGTGTRQYIYNVPGRFIVTLKAYTGSTWIINQKEIVVTLASPPIGCTAPVCNLVTNGGFEEISTCPTSTQEYLGGGNLSVLPTPAACAWNYNTYGSPDLLLNYSSGGCTFNFHTVAPSGCRGTHSGDGAVGFHCNSGGYREYFFQRLSHALVPGKTYHLSFWVAQAENCTVASDMQVAFTEDAFTDYNRTWELPTPANAIVYTTPVITNNVHNSAWVEYTFDFTPTAGCYNFITFGNFRNDANTNTTNITGYTSCGSPAGGASYIWVDDISLFPVGGVDLIASNQCGATNGTATVAEVCGKSLSTPYT